MLEPLHSQNLPQLHLLLPPIPHAHIPAQRQNHVRYVRYINVLSNCNFAAISSVTQKHTMQGSLILPYPELQSRRLAARHLHEDKNAIKETGNGNFDAPWYPSVKQALGQA